MMILAFALIACAAVLSWLSRRRRHKQLAWLRSDIPDDVAYARLRAEIDRQRQEQTVTGDAAH